MNIDEVMMAYEDFVDIENKIIEIDDITDDKIDDINDIKAAITGEIH